MGKLIFVSCGQFTAAEKRLGKSICDLVRAMPGLEPFFAEEVQDLEGLDTNILNHLRDAAGFITVLHPRGKIVRPNGSELIRASVWIEQENSDCHLHPADREAVFAGNRIHSQVGWT